MFQILPPIVIRISGVAVALAMATGGSVEIGEVAGVREDGDSEDDEHEDA